MNNWLEKLLERGPMLRCAILAIATLLVLLSIAPVVFHWSGEAGLAAAALAAALCAFGASMAVWIGPAGRPPHEALQAMLAGTIIRMAFPVIVGLAVHLSAARLGKAGLLCYLLVFYPFTLTIGTLLSLPAKRRESHPNRTAINVIS